MKINRAPISLALGFALVAGCSPRLPSPAINSATSPIDFTACRATNLNFYKLNPENFKSMVTCLNGQSGAVQPYKDLFDSMDVKDLTTVLEVLNRHFFSNPQRRNQSLDVIRKLHANGDFTPLMKGLSVAAETKVIENGSAVLSKILANNDSDLTSLKKFLIDLIDNKLFGQGIISLADIFGGISGRSLGLIFASETLTTSGSLKTDLVVDLLVTELKRSLDDGSFLKLLSALKDPTLQPSALIHPLTTQEKTDLAQYFNYTTTDAAHLAQCQNWAKVADNSATCFKKDTQYLTTNSLFLALGGEVLARSPGKEIDKFFLQTLPLDLNITERNCSFPPGSVEAIKLDEEIVRLGYGNGKRALFKALLSTKNISSELTAVKSDYFLKLGPIFAEFGRRGAYPFILNLFGQDVTPTDTVTLSQIIGRSEAADIQKNIVAVLRTMLAQDLHPLGQSVVKAMEENRGGIGDILATLASGVSLSSTSDPFQEALLELLRDEELMNRLHPIIISMLSDSRLPKLIDFTGTLAANGQLEKILVFLAEVLQTKGLPGLPGPALANSFQRPSLSPAENVKNVQAGAISILVPTEKYQECKNLGGDVLDNGSNFYKGLQCLQSENSYSQLSKITEDLKNSNLLDNAAFTFKDVVETSPYFIGALTQLQNLDQSKQLLILFKLYSIALENPYAISRQLDAILQDGFTHKEAPTFLKSVGRVLKMPNFSEAGQALIDVVTQPPKKVFQSQTDFRLHLKNEAAVRAQIAVWYPMYSKNQIESIFQRAKENFETHNNEWMTHEGSYPVLSEAQWRQEIFSFFESILRTTDIREIVLALQEIAREGHLYEMLSQTIENQKVVRHYFGDGQFVPHIMTDWDQLEELVEDADFDYAPAGVQPLSFHVAVRFEQAVVDSKNYVADMDIAKWLGKRGADVTSIGPNKPNPRFASDWAHFQNMTQNYGVLDFISNNGQLRIFQILYAGLSRATPLAFRRKSDANFNHMAGVFHLNNIGFFEQATLAMASMQSQGRLQYFINNWLGVIQLLKSEDIDSLAEVISRLVTQAKNGDTAPLDLILNKMETVQNNKEGYQEIKDTIFHIIPAINKLGVQPSGLLKGLAANMARPLAFKDTLNALIDDADNHEGDAFTISSNILRLNPEGLQALKKLSEVLFLTDLTDNTTGNPLESAIALFSDLYIKHPQEFSQVHQSLVAFLNDPKIKALQPSQLLRNILGELKGQQGVGSLIGHLLSDPASRERAISLGYGLAKSGDFAQLFEFFKYLFNSGDFESIIHFVFDNFSSSSIKSM